MTDEAKGCIFAVGFSLMFWTAAILVVKATIG